MKKMVLFVLAMMLITSSVMAAPAPVGGRATTANRIPPTRITIAPPAFTITALTASVVAQYKDDLGESVQDVVQVRVSVNNSGGLTGSYVLGMTAASNKQNILNLNPVNPHEGDTVTNVAINSGVITLPGKGTDTWITSFVAQHYTDASYNFHVYLGAMNDPDNAGLIKDSSKDLSNKTDASLHNMRTFTPFPYKLIRKI